MSHLVLMILALGCIAGAATLKLTAPGPEDMAPHINMPAPAPTEVPSAEEAATAIDTPEVPSPPGESESLEEALKPLPQSASPLASPSPSEIPIASPTPSSIISNATSKSSGGTSPLLAQTENQPLHQRMVIVDTHVETPLLISENQIKLRDNKGQVSLEKLRLGGVNVVFFSIFVNPYRYKNMAKSQADFIIKGFKKELEANQDWVELASSYADIERIVKSGKIAALMGMEGADPIGESLDNLNYFYKQGVRYLGPTWSTHTLMADSSGPSVPRWKGLSKFGKTAVERMNDLGMLIDVSHLSDAAFYDVIKLSKQPIIATHSGVDGVLQNARNLSDDMLKLIAVNGGAVGIVFYPPHLEKSGKATTESVVKHIDHAIKVMGEDHVGLGSDFDGLDRPPPTGLKDASEIPNLVNALKKKGYSEERIAKVAGGNFMRVFEDVLK
jgi:membrane dipeptidase